MASQAASNTARTNTYLIFWVDGQLFASNVSAVLEVLRNENVSPIPRNYSFIKGIINFRGEVVTVIDTGQKINMPGKASTDKNVIIIFEFMQENQEIKLGALADKVMDVTNVNENDLQAVPEFGQNFNPKYLEGTIKTEHGFALVLKIDKIFSEAEVEIIQESNQNQENHA